MGISLLMSNSTYDEPINPNPNPARFTIVDSLEKNGYTLLRVKYKGCISYKGVKLLLYNKPLKFLMGQRVLDPHFTDKGLAPVARFEPTEAGFSMAKALMNIKTPDRL